MVKYYLMGYLQIHGWKDPYCNFFAYNLSWHIFGHVPWRASKIANDIHNYISSGSDFYKIVRGRGHKRI